MWHTSDFETLSYSQDPDKFSFTFHSFEIQLLIYIDEMEMMASCHLLIISHKVSHKFPNKLTIRSHCKSNDENLNGDSRDDMIWIFGMR